MSTKMKEKDKHSHSHRNKAASGRIGKGGYGGVKVNGDSLTASGVDQYEFTEEDHPETQQEREQRRVTHNNLEKRRKDKISRGIFHLQTLLPPVYRQLEQKESLHCILEKTASYITDLQAKVSRCLLDQVDEVKDEEIDRLKQKVTELTLQNQQYAEVLRDSDVPEYMVLKPDLVIAWKKNAKSASSASTSHLAPPGSGQSSVEDPASQTDTPTDAHQGAAKKVRNRNVNTVSEQLKKLDSQRNGDSPQQQGMSPSGHQGMIAPVGGAVPPLMVPGQNPLGLMMDPQTGMFLSPGMQGPFFSPIASASEASVQRSGLEPSVLSGVSGLLSLAKAAASSPVASSLASPAGAPSPRSSIADSPMPPAEDVPAEKNNVSQSNSPAEQTFVTQTNQYQLPVSAISQVSSSGTNVTQSINMNTPIMAANQTGSNSNTTRQPAASMTVAPANQNVGLPFMQNSLTGPIQGNLVLHNGQLILLNNDQNLQTLNQGSTGGQVNKTEGQANATSNTNTVPPGVVPQTSQGQIRSSVPNPGISSQAGTVLGQAGVMTTQSGTVLGQPRMMAPNLGLPGNNLLFNNASNPGMMMNNQGQLVPGGSILGQSGMAVQSINPATGMVTMNTQPSQPNQLPSALILPTGQIVPVVTQPNLLFPQNAQSVPGGIIMPKGNNPVLNMGKPGMPLTQMSTASSMPAAVSGSQTQPFGSGLLMTTATSTIAGSIQQQGGIITTATPNVVPGSTVVTSSNHLTSQPRLAQIGGVQVVPPMQATVNKTGAAPVMAGQSGPPGMLQSVAGVQLQANMPHIAGPRPSIVPLQSTKPVPSTISTPVSTPSSSSGGAAVTTAATSTGATGGQLTAMMSADGTIVFTLPPGAQPGNLMLDPSSLPMLNLQNQQGQGTAIAAQLAAAKKTITRPGQRALMPKPSGGSTNMIMSKPSMFPAAGMAPMTGITVPGMWGTPIVNTMQDTAQSDATDKPVSSTVTKVSQMQTSASVTSPLTVAVTSDSGTATPGATSQSSTTDILAKATESIFTNLSDDISPPISSFYNPANEDNPLHIDTSAAEAETDLEGAMIQLNKPLSPVKAIPEQTPEVDKKGSKNSKSKSKKRPVKSKNLKEKDGEEDGKVEESGGAQQTVSLIPLGQSSGDSVTSVSQSATHDVTPNSATHHVTTNATPSSAVSMMPHLTSNATGNMLAQNIANNIVAEAAMQQNVAPSSGAQSIATSLASSCSSTVPQSESNPTSVMPTLMPTLMPVSTVAHTKDTTSMPQATLTTDTQPAASSKSKKKSKKKALSQEEKPVEPSVPLDMPALLSFPSIVPSAMSSMASGKAGSGAGGTQGQSMPVLSPQQAQPDKSCNEKEKKQAAAAPTGDKTGEGKADLNTKKKSKKKSKKKDKDKEKEKHKTPETVPSSTTLAPEITLATSMPSDISLASNLGTDITLSTGLSPDNLEKVIIVASGNASKKPKTNKKAKKKVEEELSNIPETITFTESELSKVLDQVEGFGQSFTDEPEPEPESVALEKKNKGRKHKKSESLEDEPPGKKKKSDKDELRSDAGSQDNFVSADILETAMKDIGPLDMDYEDNNALGGGSAQAKDKRPDSTGSAHDMVIETGEEEDIMNVALKNLSDRSQAIDQPVVSSAQHNLPVISSIAAPAAEQPSPSKGTSIFDSVSSMVATSSATTTQPTTRTVTTSAAKITKSSTIDTFSHNFGLLSSIPSSAVNDASSTSSSNVSEPVFSGSNLALEGFGAVGTTINPMNPARHNNIATIARGITPTKHIPVPVSQKSSVSNNAPTSSQALGLNSAHLYTPSISGSKMSSQSQGSMSTDIYDKKVQNAGTKLKRDIDSSQHFSNVPVSSVSSHIPDRDSIQKRVSDFAPKSANQQSSSAQMAPPKGQLTSPNKSPASQSHHHRQPSPASLMTGPKQTSPVNQLSGYNHSTASQMPCPKQSSPAGHRQPSPVIQMQPPPPNQIHPHKQLSPANHRQHQEMPPARANQMQSHRPPNQNVNLLMNPMTAPPPQPPSQLPPASLNQTKPLSHQITGPNQNRPPPMTSTDITIGDMGMKPGMESRRPGNQPETPGGGLLSPASSSEPNTPSLQIDSSFSPSSGFSGSMLFSPQSNLSKPQQPPGSNSRNYDPQPVQGNNMPNKPSMPAMDRRNDNHPAMDKKSGQMPSVKPGEIQARQAVYSVENMAPSSRTKDSSMTPTPPTTTSSTSSSCSLQQRQSHGPETFSFPPFGMANTPHGSGPQNPNNFMVPFNLPTSNGTPTFSFTLSSSKNTATTSSNSMYSHQMGQPSQFPFYPHLPQQPGLSHPSHGPHQGTSLNLPNFNVGPRPQEIRPQSSSARTVHHGRPMHERLMSPHNQHRPPPPPSSSSTYMRNEPGNSRQNGPSPYGDQSSSVGMVAHDKERSNNSGPPSLSPMGGGNLQSSQQSRSGPMGRSPHPVNEMPGFFPGPNFPMPHGGQSNNQPGNQSSGPMATPPLRHPQRLPDIPAGNQQRRGYENMPPSQQFMPNFNSPNFEPPPLQFARENPPVTQSETFSSNQNMAMQKSTNQVRVDRVEESRPKSMSSSKQKSNRKQQSKKARQYEVDTNLQNSIFESGRSMTPLFPVPALSPQPRNMQADAPTYLPNLFGNAPRPLSNSNPLQHKNPEMNNPFNPLFAPTRPQNGIGLNFQPGFPGMNPGAVHPNVPTSNPMTSHSNSVSHHVPNFNLSNLFPDVNNPGQGDSLNISPIKFPHGNPILPPQPGIDHNALQHHHQTAAPMYHNRGHPIHNAMSINSILGNHPHGFEARPMGPGINSSMASPFSGHGHPPSFGMPLNFPIHDH